MSPSYKQVIASLRYPGMMPEETPVVVSARSAVENLALCTRFDAHGWKIPGRDVREVVSGIDAGAGEALPGLICVATPCCHAELNSGKLYVVWERILMFTDMRRAPARQTWLRRTPVATKSWFSSIISCQLYCHVALAGGGNVFL